MILLDNFALMLLSNIFTLSLCKSIAVFAFSKDDLLKSKAILVFTIATSI